MSKIKDLERIGRGVLDKRQMNNKVRNKTNKVNRAMPNLNKLRGVR